MQLFWSEKLQQTVCRLQKADRPLRVAVVGIGHELCGDDIAGLAVAQGLRPYRGDNLLVLEGGSAPENQTGSIRRFGPDLVLFVDAADLDESVGTIRWLDWHETTGLTASTHTLPIGVLAKYLASEFHCHVALIGIQPANVRFDAPLTPQVRDAVDSVVGTLQHVLSPASLSKLHA